MSDPEGEPQVLTLAPSEADERSALQDELRSLEPADADEQSGIPVQEAPDGQVVTDDPSEGDWPFPFSPPPAAAEGDNRAYAVNTEDGSVVYDVAFAMVWVVDDDVEHRNEAWAFARCRDCETVAVAFQVVLVVGRADVVAPVNAAVSVNFECERCDSSAVAVQLVATLNATPDDEVLEQLDARRLDHVELIVHLELIHHVHDDVNDADDDPVSTGVRRREWAPRPGS